MKRSHLHYKKLLEKPLDDFWRSIKIISILGAFLLHQNSDIFAQISLVHLRTRSFYFWLRQIK
jgi:hypothetical protein